MSGALPDPRYIDGMEYAARLCDWLGRDWRTEPYPGQAKVAAAARGCAFAIRARLVQATGAFSEAGARDELATVRQGRAMSELRQRQIVLPVGRDEAEAFLCAMQDAARECDAKARAARAQPDAQWPGDAPAYRRCADVIRAQARALAEGAAPMNQRHFDAMGGTPLDTAIAWRMSPDADEVLLQGRAPA